MSDASPEMVSSQDRGWIKTAALAVLAVLAIGSLFFNYRLNGRVQALEDKQAAAETNLQKQIAQTQTKAEQASESLSQRVGLTQKEIVERSTELQRQQKLTAKQLSDEQQRQQQALGDVTGQVSTVKTEVGGVKTDVAATRTDLEATKAKLERAMGDLGVQSGLIATTREELDFLKHRGDRNYFDFTLSKGKTPVPVSTVSLVLKKADAKKGKFTLAVVADDKSIEKKDRTMNEPLQFYTGRDKMLYELVVYNVEKDKVTGYISTPKGAPAPITK